MEQLSVWLVVVLALIGVWLWYRHTEVIESEATVRLQSEHDHFHLIVDLPAHLKIQPGDTLQILSMPWLEEGRTASGEITYTSRILLQKASWLQRYLIRNSSLIEVKEIVEHP